MGYLGVDFPLGQDAASMPPPTTVRKAPAQAMKMAEPNSYLQERNKKEVNQKIAADLLQINKVIFWFHIST